MGLKISTFLKNFSCNFRFFLSGFLNTFIYTWFLEKFGFNFFFNLRDKGIGCFVRLIYKFIKDSIMVSFGVDIFPFVV